MSKVQELAQRASIASYKKNSEGTWRVHSWNKLEGLADDQELVVKKQDGSFELHRILGPQGDDQTFVTHRLAAGGEWLSVTGDSFTNEELAKVGAILLAEQKANA